MKNGSRFKRHRNTRPIPKLFIVLSEGSLSEPEYFEQLRLLFAKESGKNCCINIQPAIKSKNNPISLKKRMEDLILEKNYDSNYEAWIVFDRDQWDEHEIDAVEKWCMSSDRYHYALSNPKFEYWLLLHLDNVNGSISSSETTRKLKNHYPGFDKSIPRGFVTMEKVKLAYRQARAKFDSCPDIKNNNGSTVYQLIEVLAKEAGIDLL